MCAMCLCQQHASLWPPDERPTAAAVCMAESGGNPGARNHRPGIEDSRGLWQVNWLAHPRYDGEALYDPGYNAQAALDIWRGSGWQAWGAYTAGSYRRYLTGAAPVGTGAPSDPSGGLGAVLLAAVLAVVLLDVI